MRGVLFIFLSKISKLLVHLTTASGLIPACWIYARRHSLWPFSSALAASMQPGRIRRLPPEGPRLSDSLVLAGICAEGGPDPHVSFVWAGLVVQFLVSLPMWPV